MEIRALDEAVLTWDGRLFLVLTGEQERQLRGSEGKVFELLGGKGCSTWC